MFYHPLKWYHYIIILLFILIGYGYANLQKLFIPVTELRSILYVFVQIMLILFFFFIVNTSKVFKLARYLSLLLGLTITLSIVLVHFIVLKDYNGSMSKLVLMSVSAFIDPYLSALIYKGIKKGLTKKVTPSY